MTNPTWDAWNYREGTELSSDAARTPVGFSVHATDGDIGKVDAATVDVGSSYIVVDTGPWIFGRKVLLPAGTIDRIDWDDQKVYVDRTKGQIKDSPELADVDFDDPAYRDKLGSYYGDTYDRPL
ncbi:MAG TPA: PRC-barrel domain-containing protein [Dermatophilaceae bacterium]|nr:PRC-barrel domain-containing protein [Dermatophilaceae bacterium]